jgi:malate dehydrogenase (oxaloacetate-decarboxylating)(NADP+)
MAVAQAAIASGVARRKIEDWNAYRSELEKRMGRNDKLMNRIRTMVATAPIKRVAFSDGESASVIKAAAMLGSDGTVKPVLIGDRDRIAELAGELNIDPSAFEIIDHKSDAEKERREKYAKLLYEKLSRKGLSMTDAVKRAGQRKWFTLTSMMAGDTDAAIIDYTRRYTQALEPIREVFDAKEKTLASMHIVSTKAGPMFFADTAINSNPTAEELAEITVLASKAVRHFGYEPVIAMLSNSNFGTDTEEEAKKVAKAVDTLHREHPELMVDGEMKADIALDPQLRERYYPFNKLGSREVNTFIFPNLSSGNISYKMMERLGSAEIIGPVLLGLWQNIHLQSENANMRDRMNLAMIAASNSDIE